MDKSIIAKLEEILHYYEDTHTVRDKSEDVLKELLDNDVEVHGDSFFCPIWTEELGGCWLLLAGTKGRADMWVLKKILKLIKAGQPVYSMLNGNTDYLLSKLGRYNVKVVNRYGELAYISFNTKDT